MMELLALCELARDAADKIIEGRGSDPNESVVLAGYVKAITEKVAAEATRTQAELDQLASEVRALRQIIEGGDND